MRVDPKYHFKLIGRGGVEVNKLRKEFDVDVQFPREQDGPENADRLILTGFEDKANAARDKIQSIIDAEVIIAFTAIIYIKIRRSEMNQMMCVCSNGDFFLFFFIVFLLVE